MATATANPAPRLIGIDGLGALYRVLVADGYHVIGPAVQDGAIVLRELSSAAELNVAARCLPGELHAGLPTCFAPRSGTAAT